MVSLQTPLFPNQRKTISDFEDSSKKRKWEEDEEIFTKRSKTETTKSIFDIELQLETPLPLEWQRCLNIQSGQIHFYNTRTHKKTSMDPRKSPHELPNPGHMSLELELNLPYSSLDYHKDHAEDEPLIFKKHQDPTMDSSTKQKSENSGGLRRCPSWLAAEGDDQEMVATVCMRCHMLVMLCKSSPACPSCKFMHPPHHQSALQ